MELKSSAFKNNQFIPSKYTCDGEDINPPLKISAIPKNTKSLTLIVDDPDASGGTFVHWIVWNINPAIRKIFENSILSGAIEGLTDFGKTGYGGPCPPSGIHHYQFKLYALDTKLKFLSLADADKIELERAMEGHILAKANLVGLYQRR
jgi:hypothetical protein